MTFIPYSTREFARRSKMSIQTKTIFACGAVCAALITAAPACAATIIVASAGGPFSLSNGIGTLPATKLNKKNTYDFTFSMVPPVAGSVASTQLQAQTTKPVQA